MKRFTPACLMEAEAAMGEMESLVADCRGRIQTVVKRLGYNPYVFTDYVDVCEGLESTELTPEGREGWNVLALSLAFHLVTHINPMEPAET